MPISNHCCVQEHFTHAFPSWLSEAFCINQEQANYCNKLPLKISASQWNTNVYFPLKSQVNAEGFAGLNGPGCVSHTPSIFHPFLGPLCLLLLVGVWRLRQSVETCVSFRVRPVGGTHYSAEVLSHVDTPMGR